MNVPIFDIRHAKSLFGKLTAAIPPCCPFTGKSLQKPMQGIGQAHSASFLECKTGPPIQDQLRNPTDMRTHHGNAAGQCLANHIGIVFNLGGDDEHIGRRENCCFLLFLLGETQELPTPRRFKPSRVAYTNYSGLYSSSFQFFPRLNEKRATFQSLSQAASDKKNHAVFIGCGDHCPPKLPPLGMVNLQIHSVWNHTKLGTAENPTLLRQIPKPLARCNHK